MFLEISELDFFYSERRTDIGKRGPLFCMVEVVSIAVLRFEVGLGCTLVKLLLHTFFSHDCTIGARCL